MRKALAAGALSASLVAGGAAGALLFAPAISGAQTPTTEAPAAGQAPQGQPPADRSQWMADALAPLVQDGTITQAQAAAAERQARLESAYARWEALEALQEGGAG